MLKIKPNPNKKIEGKPIQVFDPVRKDFLPAEGRDVPNSEYWTRRIADGSVVKTDTIETKKKPTANEKKAKTSKAKKADDKTTETSSESADKTASEDVETDKKED